jgi:superfamily I DNA and/or RNA helicase
MRHQSIREVCSGDSGRVVRDMKPVWLMSPLSVSDTLPLEAGLFDVVIFDEARRIPVEEAVPALVRAPQVIVVGDEMQLPPTRFFTAAREDGEDEENGERIAVMLDTDSLLNQAACHLPATLLAWHYRCSSESLIGYSNAAFYAGQLHTVPEPRLPAPGLGEIHVEAGSGDAAAHADALLARPISVHQVAGAVHAQRRNEAEARHIAALVRELLARETGQSLGIVAFSPAQQGEIEAALAALAAQDPAFAARLEAESQREHDDQFVGLIVKNLENVQGDERDIVIVSLCHGPSPDGRMRMNFGPITQRGGEKLLNVIFSRARQHMAVVTSIRHEAITQEGNEGVAALKHFLRYAEHLSRGEPEAAQRVLHRLNPAGRRSLAHEPAARDVVRRQLAQALRERGHAVDECVGQSRFRCDLAVRAAGGGPGGEHYALGILLDAAGAEGEVFERYVARPRILAGFGWRCVQVPGRDWVEDPGRVMAWVERALEAGVDT